MASEQEESHMSESDQPAHRAHAETRGASAHPSRKRTVGVTLVVIGALYLASHTMDAFATPAVVKAPAGGHRAAVAAVPPPGSTWIEGVVTDQADHGQDDVNVEAWSTDPGATAPVASSLTYGGPPSGLKYQHGFFLLEVPSNQPYRIVFSGVGGKEDGDLFRMKSYGHGRPIVVRNLAAPGRTRDLGPVQLVRQGRVASTTKAILPRAKVTAGTRATLRVRVTSPFVTSVTGKVVVRVAGKKKITHRLTQRSHGKSTFKLPHMKKPGRYKVTASFTRTGTVQHSKAKPVRLTVHRKK
jgi:hypothetical protein